LGRNGAQVSSSGCDEIGIWAEGWDEDPKSFIWKKPADEIIAKVQRGRSKLASIKSATDH
jgi:hypothetical protein